MAGKKRYLVGSAKSGVVPQAVQESIDCFLKSDQEVQRVRDLKGGHRVISMTRQQAEKLVADQPHLLVEEDHQFKLSMPMPGLHPRVPAQAEHTLTARVNCEETQGPIANVTVYAHGAELTYQGLTDQAGIAKIRVFEDQVQRVIASPRDTYWSKVMPGMDVSKDAEVAISLNKIEVKESLNWGRAALGLDQKPRFTGKGVKIAIIDSGIAGNKDYQAAGGYNTLDGQSIEAWNVDEQGHGTHCTGIIASQNNHIGITGMAPQADTYSLKVFPGGWLSDLVEAVNWCIDHHIDVINMSLGSSVPSEHLRMVLQEAEQRGITCVAAAGNEAGAVSFPAAFETVIAVSAIGKCSAFPESSAHALRIGDHYSSDGRYFFAKFSNFGERVDVCGPGVAIVSTVPTGYASWDGTSMACPYIAGLAALVLEAYPSLRTGDAWQPYYVREIIKGSSIDLGLPAQMQGAGLPDARLALYQATAQHDYQEAVRNHYRDQLAQMLAQARDYAQRLEEMLAKIEHLESAQESAQ